MADNTGCIKLFGNGAEDIDYDSIDCDAFTRIAESLLNKHQIIVDDKTYRICEIEFYVKNDAHNDEYTHCDDHQATYGKWYFHRTKTGNYKGGTYKGMDLTLGREADEEQNIDPVYFGVLIRSIYSEEDDEFIEGPCKVVNTFLNLSNCKDIKEYMEGRADPPSVRSTRNFHIKRCRGLKKHDLYSGPRIGLSAKFPKYQKLSYRYIIMKDKIAKQKRSLNKVE